jgi:hypothetical protein
MTIGCGPRGTGTGTGTGTGSTSGDAHRMPAFDPR